MGHGKKMKFDPDYIEPTIITFDEEGFMEIASQGTDWQITSIHVIEDFVYRYNKLLKERDSWKESAIELYDYYYLNSGTSQCIPRFQQKLGINDF